MKNSVDRLGAAVMALGIAGACGEQEGSKMSEGEMLASRPVNRGYDDMIPTSVRVFNKIPASPSGETVPFGDRFYSGPSDPAEKPSAVSDRELGDALMNISRVQGELLQRIYTSIGASDPVYAGHVNVHEVDYGVECDVDFRSNAAYHGAVEKASRSLAEFFHQDASKFPTEVKAHERREVKNGRATVDCVAVTRQ